jgi:hypothetical protein
VLDLLAVEVVHVDPGLFGRGDHEAVAAVLGVDPDGGVVGVGVVLVPQGRGLQQRRHRLVVAVVRLGGRRQGEHGGRSQCGRAGQFLEQGVLLESGVVVDSMFGRRRELPVNPDRPAPQKAAAPKLRPRSITLWCGSSTAAR